MLSAFCDESPVLCAPTRVGRTRTPGNEITAREAGGFTPKAIRNQDFIFLARRGRLSECRLGGGQACDGHPVRGTGHVIQA